MKNNKESDEFNYEEIDKQLEEQINNQIKELENLKTDFQEIGNPNKLTESISQIVWEQFVIQIAGQAGQDFIKENDNLNLSLKKADHFLSEENFVEGKLPKHNQKNIKKYEDRYEKYQNSFKQENGKIVTHTDTNGDEVNTIASNARKPYDKNRPTGDGAHGQSKDHVIPVSDIIRDKKAGAYLDQNEKVEFANSGVNLQDMSKEMNSSKGDKTVDEWLKSKNHKGQTPQEEFNLKLEDIQKMKAEEEKANKEWEAVKDKGEKRAIAEGKESIKKEVLNSAKHTAQAVLMALLAKLTRTVFQELIRWLMQKDKKISTFLDSLIKAFSEFFTDLKGNGLLIADVGITTILTQIFGKIIPEIKKALLFIKIGGDNVYKINKYLKDPNNKNKETSVKVLEVGKIVTIGMTTAGAIGLGTVFTTVLEKTVPALAIPIPVLGSPSSILGIFFGGITAGICGAIVLNSIDGALNDKKISENITNQLVLQGNILSIQDAQFTVHEKHIEDSIQQSINKIESDLSEATEIMKEKKNTLDEKRTSKNKDKFDEISNMLKDKK